MSKQIDLQDVYDTLEECAICDGVPGVAEWIKQQLQEQYKVVITHSEELDELLK